MFSLPREERERVISCNNRFNDELDKQAKGELPGGHIYNLGRPTSILRSAGFPDTDIELSSSKLAEKARQHGFSIEDVRNLVSALHKPVAVFSYGDKTKAQNVIAEIERDGKNFVVGVHFSQVRGKTEVSSIRGLFPKDNAEWLNWVSQDKLLYVDKKKIQTLIDQQRTNPADVAYLDLDSVAKIIENFENPSIEAGKIRKTTEISKKSLDSPSEIAEREVRNVVVKSGRDRLPTSRREAKVMLDRMEQPFHNNDQDVDIYVSHGDATHMMNFRNEDQIKVVGVIDQVIAEAVKIGQMPVHEEESSTTKAVHIYYCPVNIDGQQYSGRMVVKEYFQGNQVVDELHLYNTQLRKETSNAQSHSPEGIPAHPSEVKNRYKVKELIHSSQEFDKKILNLTEYDRLKFSLPGEAYEQMATRLLIESSAV